MRILTFLLLPLALSCSGLWAQQLPASNRSYILGPDDGITVNVVDLPELEAKTLGVIRIDHQGNIRLPLAGRIEAAGRSVEGLETEIVKRLSGIMNAPEVSVSVAEYRSHPVSVLGAVRNPGVYQVTGPKTLFEVLSLAGGLNPDASNRIKIMRATSAGPLPLANASSDKTGEFYTAELNVKSVMEAKNPEENINVLSNDVITVPKADMVYVVGAVHKSGGFPLSEKEEISVLQAVSLAEGLDSVAKTSGARILRQLSPGAQRTEVAVNVQKILDGRAQDVPLQANDILFIPNSLAKSASMRILNAALQAGTGVAIYGH
ncbi:MAG TPA: polysaccharide biosynthesis/export family protein [Bryobacteraceae bacterium]